MLTSFVIILLAILISYLLGSVSSAILVCKMMNLPDPRQSGSHNPGATNVLRIGGKGPAILTLFGDVLKGYIAVAVALQISHASWFVTEAPGFVAEAPWLVAPVMVAVFLGHLYPIFFKFEGGKGVATAFGIYFALHWPFGLVLLCIWLLVAIIFKYSSLAALVAALCAPLLGFFYFKFDMLYCVALLITSILLFWRHKINIIRLISGEETKIGKK